MVVLVFWEGGGRGKEGFIFVSRAVLLQMRVLLVCSTPLPSLACCPLHV